MKKKRVEVVNFKQDIFPIIALKQNLIHLNNESIKRLKAIIENV